MNGKLGALALALAVFGTAVTWLTPYHPAAVPVTAPDLELLPANLAGVPFVNKWRNERRGTIVEDVAEYKPFFGGTSVMLAFFRGRPSEHNGINCLIARGEYPIWQRQRVLETASGPTAFVVAMLQAPDRLRLIASTQCRASHCDQALDARQGRLPVLNWDLRNPRAPATSVVPVSIIVTPIESLTGDDAVEQRLLRALSKAAAATDLRPARRLAAVQQGAPSKRADHLVDAHTLNPLRE